MEVICGVRYGSALSTLHVQARRIWNLQRYKLPQSGRQIVLGVCEGLMKSFAKVKVGGS